MLNPIFRPVTVVAMMFAATGAAAQTAPSQVRQGQMLAEQACVKCHVVAAAGGTGWTDAPSFLSLANRDGASAAKLSVFIQQPHMHMLDVARPPNEANALAAYIMSLRAH